MAQSVLASVSAQKARALQGNASSKRVRILILAFSIVFFANPLPGMVGYTESLTDPSYEGQILILTYPLIGNYGVPERPSDPWKDLPLEFESTRIHVAGLVVGYYSEDFSHFLASSSLGTWLKENGIPAIHAVDTRALTKKIRAKGSMLGKLVVPKQNICRHGSTVSQSQAPSRASSPPLPTSWREDYLDIPFADPNTVNLVSQVSIKVPRLYKPTGTAKRHPTENRTLRIIAIDVGIKFNQIRCFISRGVELKVVPWDHDFLRLEKEPFDGLFVSNGPGDPSTVKETIAHLSEALQHSSKPIFGICLGHQLLALAAGASTSKMKYGNRGHNIPCTDAISGRCYITSQNHGYQVDTSTLPTGWKELFKNANDDSNEGIYCEDKPVFSVQFHPESTPGPRDTEFLFDVFIQNVEDCARTGSPMPIHMPGGKIADNDQRPRPKVKKVLILGSGTFLACPVSHASYAQVQVVFQSDKQVNLTTLDPKRSKLSKRRESIPFSSTLTSPQSPRRKV